MGNQKNQDLAFYSGLFDPFTRGHLNIVIRTLREYDRIITGLENGQDARCDFSIDERMAMVRQTISDFLRHNDAPIQFRAAVADRLRQEPNILRIAPIEGEVVDTVIKYRAEAMVRGVRNETDQHIEEELRDRILLQFRIRNYNLKDYILQTTNGCVVHMSSTVCKSLCQRGEYIAALHHVTPGVHNMMMPKYLKPRFEALFPEQKDLWNELLAVYMSRPLKNFTHVAYMLNRIQIDKVLQGLTLDTTTLERAVFFKDISGSPAASAAWVAAHLETPDSARIQELILSADYDEIPSRMDAETRLFMRSHLLVMTDEENYPLYLRMIKAEGSKNIEVGRYGCLRKPLAYLEKTKLFFPHEVEKMQQVFQTAKEKIKQ